MMKLKNLIYALPLSVLIIGCATTSTITSSLRVDQRINDHIVVGLNQKSGAFGLWNLHEVYELEDGNITLYQLLYANPAEYMLKDNFLLVKGEKGVKIYQFENNKVKYGSKIRVSEEVFLNMLESIKNENIKFEKVQKRQ